MLGLHTGFSRSFFGERGKSPQFIFLDYRANVGEAASLDATSVEVAKGRITYHKLVCMAANWINGQQSRQQLRCTIPFARNVTSHTPMNPGSLQWGRMGQNFLQQLSLNTPSSCAERWPTALRDFDQQGDESCGRQPVPTNDIGTSTVASPWTKATSSVVGRVLDGL